MDDMSHEPEDDGDAARAFEALREEVAALRRGVELVYRQGQQSGTIAPDYSPTLGKMEKALQAIAGRLEAVERQPALRLTPASFRSEIDNVALSVVGAAGRPFADAVQEVRGAARDLKTLAGRVREQREQRCQSARKSDPQSASKRDPFECWPGCAALRPGAVGGGAQSSATRLSIGMVMGWRPVSRGRTLGVGRSPGAR